MPTKLAHRLAPRVGNTSFLSFLGEQIKQVEPIKISCWQRSSKEIQFDYTQKKKNKISNALQKEDNYVKSKVIRSAEEHISFRWHCGQWWGEGTNKGCVSI
jgi:hypothetical protein